MIRTDIFGLSESVLLDLTNRGTLRRAHKLLETTAVEPTTSANGDVHVVLGDNHCELLADKAFPDWTCTCVKATSCHHIVAAVLGYQQACKERGDGDEEDVPTPSTSVPMADPAVGTVFMRDDVPIVRIAFPEPVTVRFLQGNHLDYARCTCAQTDPCAHVPIALALLDAPDSPVRTVGTDEWCPDPGVLTAVSTQIDTMCAVGIESSHTSLVNSWRRVRERCDSAGMPNAVELIDTIVDLQERRESRDCSFDPDRLVSLVGELAARLASLQLAEPNVPHRLVAGVNAEPVKLSRCRLIGLGTEVLSLPGGCEVVAHLVDARSGSPMTVRKVVEGEPANPAKAVVSNVPLHNWGGGQVLISGGRRDSWGQLNVTRYKCQAFPAPALTELFAPWAVDSFAALATDGVPAALGPRTAGSGICAVRNLRLAAWGHDVRTRGIVGTLIDDAGHEASLRFAPHIAGLDADALAHFCAQHEHQQISISGRWRTQQGRMVVDPFLLIGELGIVQPHVGEAVEITETVGIAAAQVSESAATRVQKILSETLGHVLVAGTERLQRDPDFFPTRARQLRNLGSSWLAGLVDAHSPEAIRRLLLASALAE